MKTEEVGSEVSGLFELIGSVNEELKDVFRLHGLSFLADIQEALQFGESEENISRLAWYGEKVFNEISVLAEARGVPFYPHDMQRLNDGIGLNNLISLMNGRKTPELEEMLRDPTEEERKFGMAPSVAAAECEYNVIGYFLAVLLKKLYVQLEESRVRRESGEKDI